MDSISEKIVAFGELIAEEPERDAVIESALGVLCAFTGCSRGGLFLLDNEDRLLHLQAPAFGDTAESISALPTISLDLDNAVFAQPNPTLPLYLNLSDTPGSWPAALVERYGVTKVVCVTFLRRDHIVGLFVGDTAGEDAGQATSTVWPLLTLMASSLALYTHNLRLREEVDTDRSLLRLHKVFSTEAAENRPLSQIVARLARESGLPAILENRVLRPLAAAEPRIGDAGDSVSHLALPDAVKRSPEFRDFLRGLTKSGQPASPPPFPQASLPDHRLTIAVVAASRHLGFLSLVQPHPHFRAAAHAALSIGANAIALKMLYDKVALDVEENIKQDFLCNVVTNNYTTETAIIEKANYLGYDITIPFNVVYMSWFDPKSCASKVLPQPALSHVSQELKRCSPRSIVSTFRNTNLFMLVDSEHDMDLHDLISKTIDIVSSHVEQTFCVGIGKVAARPQYIKDSFEQAKETVGIMQQMGKYNCVEHYEHLGAYSVLLSVNNIGELDSFAIGILGKLIQHDAEKNSDLLHTLTVFLSETGSHKDISAKLHVHVNTLKYRLQKIQEILGMALEDPEDRFNIHLAIKSLRVSKARRS